MAASAGQHGFQLGMGCDGSMLDETTIRRDVSLQGGERSRASSGSWMGTAVMYSIRRLLRHASRYEVDFCISSSSSVVWRACLTRMSRPLLWDEVNRTSDAAYGFSCMEQQQQQPGETEVCR